MCSFNDEHVARAFFSLRRFFFFDIAKIHFAFVRIPIFFARVYVFLSIHCFLPILICICILYTTTLCTGAGEGRDSCEVNIRIGKDTYVEHP